jgi:hypothetical protein
MNRTRWLLASALLGLGVVCVGFLLSSDLEDRHPATEVRSTISSPSTHGAAPVRAEPQRSDILQPNIDNKNARVGISDALRDSFNKSNNLAAFVQEALLKPESGGYYYARLALYTCFDAPPALAAAEKNKESMSSIPAAAMAALERLTTRCASFDQHFSQTTIAYAIRETRLGKDPLLELSRQSENLVSSIQTKDFLRLLGEANKLGDPYLTAQILNIGAFEIVQKTDPTYFKTGGNLQAAQRAAGSVYCELTGTCDWGKISLIACLQDLECNHADERILVRSSYIPAEDIAAYDRALETFRRLVGLSS